MVMNSTPQISIILPVKDGGPYIEAAIASILRQSFHDFELIIIDDASSDGSSEIAGRLSGSDPRVKLLRNPGNGLVDALNFGISASRAPLIGRMDADDIALPGRLQRQYDFLNAHPEIDAVGTQVSFIDEQGALTGKTTTLPESPDAIAKTLLNYCCLRHPTVVMRRTPLERAGGYRKQFPDAEDLDLWLRIAEHGQLANLPEPLLLYRLHSAQVTQRRIWTQRLSRNLAIISAQARRAGRGDPVATYACLPDAGRGHDCRGLGCSTSVCDSLRVFAAAEKLLSNSPAEVSHEDARLLLGYVSRHAIGDGKTNRIRVLIALCHMAARRRAPLLLARALALALRIHPGRAVRLLIAKRIGVT
jgi:GT2 family glycosyltransferase